MKKLLVLVTLMVVCTLGSAWAVDSTSQDCTTIQDGLLIYSPGRYLEGQLVETGYDVFGYNYQAHMFNSLYCNYYLNVYGLPPYEGDDEAYYERLVAEGYATDVPAAQELMSSPTYSWLWNERATQLMMKWNDAWLANKDCDGDGLLDRYYGFPSYIGSGAWCTNHMSDGQGKDHWVFFCKIVAVPDDATEVDDIWYAADGTEIGASIWGSFAIVQEVESGLGATYVSPAGPGFGQY